MTITDKPATEDAFMRAFMPMIASIAGSVWRKNRRYELEDLRAYGAIGALNGYRTWQPGGEASLSTYCFTCIRNAVYRGMRTMAPIPRPSLKRAEREHLALGLMAADELASTPLPCPEAQAIARQTRDALRRSVRRLSPVEADVIGQMLLGGSPNDVARVKGVSTAYVYETYARGVARLRSRMVAA